MGPDPRLERAVINEMALRDRRLGHWSSERHSRRRQVVSPPEFEPKAHRLGHLSGVARTVSGLLLRTRRRAIANRERR
jgi:hypothetical protein